MHLFSISQIDGIEFVPVILFHSEQWRGDGDDYLSEEVLMQHPWIMYFNGNDDASYYVRFKTEEEAMRAWYLMQDCGYLAKDMLDAGSPFLYSWLPKNNSLEHQTSDLLCYFRQN